MKKILIVEDEENIREVCKRYLEREEYEVYTAVNGTEGWIHTVWGIGYRFEPNGGNET